MDRPKIDYRQKFEKLAKRNGEIVAIVSSNVGSKFASTEYELLEEYEEAKAHNEKMPDDLKEGSAHLMEVGQQARAAIQDYKRRKGIPFDTPPVSETPPPRKSNAANDPVYDADIYTPEI